MYYLLHLTEDEAAIAVITAVPYVADAPINVPAATVEAVAAAHGDKLLPQLPSDTEHLLDSFLGFLFSESQL